MSDTPQDPKTDGQQQPEEPTPDTGTPPAPNGGESGSTFTQADLERIISDRLKRDREAQQNKLLESLGVSSLDDAKKALEAKRKAEEEQMSELEKAQARIAEMERKAQEAEQRVQEMQAKQLADNRKATFLDAIRQSGGSNEGHVYVLVQAELADQFQQVFEDNSAKPDDGKLKAFVKEVQTKFPMYFGTAGAGSPSNAGGVNPTSKQQALEDAKKEIEDLF